VYVTFDRFTEGSAMTIPFITRFTAMLALAIVATAVGASILWGRDAGFGVLGAATALVALAKALIDLSVRLSTTAQPSSDPPRTDTIAVRQPKSVVVIALLAGVAFGACLPPLAAWAGRPEAALEIPGIVQMRQLAVLTWQNVPDDRTALLIVYSRRDDVWFPQPCQSDGRRRGRLVCDLEIGGTGDAGGDYDVAVVLATAAAREELLSVSRDPGYFRKLSNQLEVVTRKRVTRTVDGH
jgi:hypothetical protein